MERSKPKIRRCAIYTRKSSEEGLEQEFNSLHAQREACEAFIKSQAGEGWRLIRTHYDDGGLSGATMERPALKRLMADIAKGLIDAVVVYKVDRLTRSLADFAKMVEVSITAAPLSSHDPAIQYHRFDGPPNIERLAVVRTVRTRGDQGAHPRQDRRLQAQGHLGRRPRAARVRGARAPAGHKRSRSHDRETYLHALL